MTNEEAIKILKEVREEVFAKETELSKQVFENLGIKALDLAIKALEQQPNDDCISRKAIKDMLTNEWTKYMPMELDINLSFVLDKISALPSVTPSYNSVKTELEQTRWIPVSERLPEDYIHVLCQFTLNGMGECYLAHGVFHVVGGLVMTCNEVIAWMPLPQPYKAESEEENEENYDIW